MTEAIQQIVIEIAGCIDGSVVWQWDAFGVEMYLGGGTTSSLSACIDEARDYVRATAIRLTGGGSTELADSVPSKRALAAAEAVLQHRRIWHAFLGGLELRHEVAMLIDTERECCAIIAEHYPEAGGAEIAARIRAMR